MYRMQINGKAVGDVEIICPCGRMDAYSSCEVENKLNSLIDTARIQLVVSLKELEYISSSGLRVFLATLKKVRKQHGDIRLSGLTTQVKEVFDMAGFTRLFTILESEESAVDSYKKK
jgi:anti-sigma B factor antagonist